MRITFADYMMNFDNCSGGFPTEVTQILRHNRVSQVIHTVNPWLSVTFTDGRTAVPKLADDYAPLYRTDEEGVQYIQYSNIGFVCEGKELDKWRLGLSYECYPDGNVFIGISFTALESCKPDISSFQLNVPVEFGEDSNTVYGYRRRYRTLDPTGIHSSNVFVRALQDKKNLSIQETLPLIAFDFGKQGKLSRHFEMFIEDQCSLDEDPEHVKTMITWQAGNPVLTYEFSTIPVHNDVKPYYWRNRIGFTLGQTPKWRDKAPLRLYHYFDEEKILPTAEQIRRMAAEGADVLALHECWRTDMRNGGIAYDEKRFFDLIRVCHKYGIRVTPYIRGDYESAVDDKCNWFFWYLKKDYDGLYIDYGAVDGFFELGGRYPGGRFAFKRYYDQYRRLRRETIGKDGVMTVHTGPFFSAGILTSLVDGYVAGEGEQGVLLDSRMINEYFSETTISPGSLWTAAFPAYQTQRVLPHMANTGQFPHVTLGSQWKSSCLSHPDEPGNVIFARPLWRLYGLMKDERHIQFDNDVCDEDIHCDDVETGLSVFRMSDGAALLLMSNFSGKARLCRAEAPVYKLEGQKCYRLYATVDECTVKPYAGDNCFEEELSEYGIGGFLFCDDNEKWQQRIQEFVKPYPAKYEAALAYERNVEKARSFQLDENPVETAYLKMDMPAYHGTFETEFWYDSYEKVHELLAIDENGQRKRIGYLSRKGLTAIEPACEDGLYPEEETDWIPLHSYLKKGKYTIEVHTYRNGADVNIKCHMLVSEKPSAENARDISFFSEINQDRSRLSFRLNLI